MGRLSRGASVWIVSLLAFGWSCAEREPAADSIYFGGTVVTGDDSNPVAEAVAVRDGIIVAVGSENEVRELQAGSTRLIDLDGKTLVPGFIDGH
nr:amidohydrolase [Acidobacteriota bacterium]NIQ86662.1 amidohydrolase [Acidobacteriota bacterium]